MKASNEDGSKTTGTIFAFCLWVKTNTTVCPFLQLNLPVNPNFLLFLEQMCLFKPRT